VQQGGLDREWLTLREMQEMFSIGRTKAWQLVASGEVPAVKIGHSVRVSRRELERWLEEQRYLDVVGHQ